MSAVLRRILNLGKIQLQIQYKTPSRLLSSPSTIPSGFKVPPPRFPPHSPPPMPSYRYNRDKDAFAAAIAHSHSDLSIHDNSPFMASFDSFDGAHHSDMIFDFDELQSYEPKSTPNHNTWDTPTSSDYPMPGSTPSSYLASPESTSSQLEFGSPAHLTPSDHAFDNNMMMTYGSNDFNTDAALYRHWITDPDMSPLHTSSAPIDIPAQPPLNDHFASGSLAYSDNSSIFPDVGPFSPTTAFAALQPLPRSFSPSSANPGDTIMTDTLRGYPEPSSSGPDYHQMSPPNWATQLFTAPAQPQSHPPAPPLAHLDASTSTLSPPMASMSIPFQADSEDAFATQRPRMHPQRRDIASVSQMFQSSSAPSVSHMHTTQPLAFTRAYSRRAESISESDDRDATIRRKRRSPTEDEDEIRAAPSDREKSPPLKSVLKPPKLAPSAWQLYFTDWIARHQASSHKKLNVAQAAKEAGQEYARLSSEQKEPYRRRSQAAKEARERDLAAYMRTLTPEDIKRENAFRTAQRKAGKSRRGNIKDPNAPKKPLSAYFMFLQRIRSDPELVKEVFGDETETTKQSVLAAAKWRSMTDDERKPFLAQAEQEKLEYESARKVYEEGTTGYTSSFSSSINFSILPGGPINAIAFPSFKSSNSTPAVPRVKSEVEADGSGVGSVVMTVGGSEESESDGGFLTDDSHSNSSGPEAVANAGAKTRSGSGLLKGLKGTLKITRSGTRR
ncbi:hypothetical protein QCA50_020147 [Cerrena zonata]|uniref:HMG box domain-containing protein n=1 Tax=Cerrena zonata TaxID=2478898 RepID=A0AAW0FHU2_9APHY